MDYLGEQSDLDLILPCAAAEMADAWFAALADIDMDAPMRIDAELVGPSGEAVHWREWGGGAREVLAKSLEGARMVSREKIFA